MVSSFFLYQKMITYPVIKNLNEKHFKYMFFFLKKNKTQICICSGLKNKKKLKLKGVLHQNKWESIRWQCESYDAHICACRTTTIHPSEPSVGRRPYQSGPQPEVEMTNTIRQQIHHPCALTVIVLGLCHSPPVRNTRDAPLTETTSAPVTSI